ncbi:MAG: HD domain-containing phosphohydrolase [Alphaproteobacteria bacterium]
MAQPPESALDVAPAADARATAEMAAEDAAESRRARNKIGLISILLVVAGVASMVAAIRLVQDAADREARAWQVRLGIVADSRASALAEWIDSQSHEVAAIAANPSVSLTLTELAMADGNRGQVVDFDGQAAYLRNYLTTVAEQAGFSLPVAASVGADVAHPRTSGMAIVDPRGEVVAATRDMPPLEGELAEALRLASHDAPELIDAYLSDGGPRVGFIAPIFRLQTEPGAENFVGLVVGLRPLDADFLALLEQPGTTEESAKTLIARRAGERVDVIASTDAALAPLAYGAEAADRSLVLAQVFDDADGFVEGAGETGAEVMASARAVPGTPWVVVYQLDRDEALAESDSRLTRLMIFLLLIVALVVGIMAALWRHGASVRAARAAARFRGAADRIARQERFLRLVTDAQPSAMFVTDANGICRFANATLAHRLGVGLSDVVGASLNAAFGRDRAREYARAHDDALAQNATVALRCTVESADRGKRVVQALHVPMSDISPELDGAVLTVEEDITELMAERERNSQNLHKLVDTLVTIIDARDPYAAEHSVRVGEIAERIAREMVVDQTVITTTRIAGTLLNVGKILVPADVLTSHRNLGEAEMRKVRESILRGADLLEGVAFDGPVAETVRQAQEHFDGSGLPRGLAGDGILLSAGIVAVANAFVALVSARAHRPGVDIDRALAHIHQDVGTVFDRAVVSALGNVLDNRGGRELVAGWEDNSEPEGRQTLAVAG